MMVIGLVLSVYVSQNLYVPIGEIIKEIRAFPVITRENEKGGNEYDSIMKNLNAVMSTSERSSTSWMKARRTSPKLSSRNFYLANTRRTRHFYLQSNMILNYLRAPIA
jgi:hypothetical protein